HSTEQTLSEATAGSESPRHWRPLWAQFLIFSVVGAANTALDAGVFALLVGLFGWREGFEPVAASVLGFLAGSLHSYLWNSRVTSGHRGPGPADSPRLVGRFLAVAIGGAIVSALAFSAVREVWPFDRFVLTASKLAAMAVALAWNFSLMRFWVFASRHPG